MKVVITGGAGFLGLQLARRLTSLGALTGGSSRPEPIDEIALFDMAVPESRVQGLDDRAKFITGEISDAATVRRLFDRPDLSVFHLASVVSGGGELDFDLAMRVNLHGNLHVLESARALGSRPRAVFASSIAVFGGSAMPKKVGDATKQTPQTTYGMTKSIGELLVNDYTRKGFIDGRSARLPTVIVRPGKPNKAASSFASGVFREPLNGVPCVLPVGLETIMPLAGYRTIVEGFVRLHEADGAALGEDRAVSLPSLDVTVADMIAALKRVAGNRPLGDIRVEPDPTIERIVATWPTGTVFERAIAIGLPKDRDLDSIVRAYIADFLQD
ncbi:MAG: D-erythronate dehydrogenase [Dongiaceae bacterium]